MREPTIVHTAVFVALSAIITGSVSRADLYSSDKLDLPADFRIRLEQDYDSQDASGVERSDRLRARARVRVGLRYRHDEHWGFELRLRSGSDLSQQSPHITLVDFTDNDTGDADFNFDKWNVRWKNERCWVWIGRNGHPFWRQNEMLFDDDATLAGLAGGWSSEGDRGSIRLNAGYFSLPVGLQEFSGNLGGLQAVYARPGDTAVTVALGFYDFESGSSDPDAPTLLGGNGARDYAILQASAQAKREVRGHPLTLGVDLLSNAEDYSPSDPDPVTAANHDETDGFVVSARYDGLGEDENWQVGYTYSRIETFAVNASFAQDDWVRWGSASETRSSNLKGHELRVRRTLSGQANLLLRVYLVESITTVEDGNRARLDLNYRF